MGWDFLPRKSKQYVLRHLTQPSNTSVCLAHTYLAESKDSGTLWSVRQQKSDGRCWIACDLLERQDGTWGYKRMDESVHPYYYDCPIGYLDMAPVACPLWRAKVQQHHKVYHTPEGSR